MLQVLFCTDNIVTFWDVLQYAKYMESRDVEKSRQAFRRACTIHLPQKASLHLAWAAFEERHGCHFVDMHQFNLITTN